MCPPALAEAADEAKVDERVVVTSTRLDDKATSPDLLPGKFLALRRGKKNWHLAKWE